jgi:hypothetical protein
MAVIGPNFQIGFQLVPIRKTGSDQFLSEKILRILAIPIVYYGPNMIIEDCLMNCYDFRRLGNHLQSNAVKDQKVSLEECKLLDLQGLRAIRE